MITCYGGAPGYRDMAPNAPCGLHTLREICRASTVRLYTKHGTYASLPFLTMAFPLVCIGVLTLGIAQAGSLGPHLQALHITWSPYHYAAQAYGLVVMYSYRSGCQLSRIDKKLLWWVSMLPFFYTFLTTY